MRTQKLSGIPETLLIALWARATATQADNPLILDNKAVEMVAQIDYDFSRFEHSNKYTVLGVAVRTMLLDAALMRFLKNNPRALVINFGAGLDTRHSRLSCVDTDWYEIDVPEAIALRKQFFTESAHYHFIAQSIFDSSWISKIKVEDRPVIILAEGLLMYFKEDELKPLFCEITRNFPNAHMLFEMIAPIMVGKSKHHETVKAMDSKAEFLWSLKNSKELESWHTGIHFIEEWNYVDYQKKSWGLFGRIARLPLIRPAMACRIVHICFNNL